MADEIESAIKDYTGVSGRGAFSKIYQRVVDYLTNRNVASDSVDEIIFDRTLMNLWRCRVSETWFKEYVERTMVCDKRNWETWWFNPRKKADQVRLAEIKQIASQYPRFLRFGSVSQCRCCMWFGGSGIYCWSMRKTPSTGGSVSAG